MPVPELFKNMTPEQLAEAAAKANAGRELINTQPAPGMAPVTIGGQTFDTGNRSSAYIAFLRQLGLQEDQARAAAEQQKSEISRRLTMRLPEISQNFDRSRQNLSASLEGRGVLRSGETDRRMAENRQAEQGATADAQTAAAEGISGVERATANQVGQLRTQAAEKEQQDISQQQATRDAQAAEQARAKAEQDARDTEYERNKELLQQQMDAQQKQYEAQLAAIRGGA